MWDKIKFVGTKWLQGLTEFFLLFPILLLLSHFIVPPTQLFLWVSSLPIAFLIGLLLKRVLGDQKRWVFIIIVYLVSLALTLAFFASPLPIIFSIVITAFFLYRGVLYANEAWWNLLPVSKIWAGIGINLVCYFIFRLTESLSIYVTFVTWVIFVSLSLAFFISNSRHVRGATLADQQRVAINKVLKWQNRIFVIIFISILVLITNLGWIRAAYWYVVTKVGQFISWLTGLLEQPESGGGTSLEEMVDEGLPPAKETSWLMELIQNILYYIMFTVTVLFLAFVLYHFIKQLYRAMNALVRKIYRFFTQLTSKEENEDEEYSYIDEKESLFNVKDVGSEYTRKMKDWLATIVEREPKWHELKNVDKVRYLFRKLLVAERKLGFEVKSSQTAREMLQELQKTRTDEEMAELVTLYEQARYGDQSIDEEKIVILKSYVEKKS
ncbi:DUF4129 domain-containing protein [Bacillus alkalicellulosilyticus]|uniref:DUF4129 domain-containing protein n=1 Tax=Alkalihalobacterium alkalicellulosilyticum TaxID=1912214 RepID=UPI0009983785|nr:DUF4129 domain-containing protein [Bacillus alkalicellulosilyticus]